MKKLVPLEGKDEKRDFNKIFKTLKSEYNIDSPGDLIQLNMLCNDILRLKAAYARMGKTYHFQQVRSQSGEVSDGVNPVGFYINQLEGQIRSSMRELQLTRKSEGKKDKIQDFSSFAAEVIEIEPGGTKGEVRSKTKGKA